MFVKFFLGIGGAGIVTTTGVCTYLYLNSKYTIKDLLKIEASNLKILNKDSENKNNWVNSWKKYIEANSDASSIKEKDAWELEKWSEIGKVKETVPEAFAQKCGSKINEKVNNKDEKKYKDFVNWCTVK